MADVRFFKCAHCGNIAALVEDMGVELNCCGEAMKELKANTSDGAKEKHVPVVTVEGNTVKAVVGSVEHPMLPEHHIAWIYLKTNQGAQRKVLDVNGKPEAVFALADGEKALAVYEYCNLHGLWRVEL